MKITTRLALLATITAAGLATTVSSAAAGPPPGTVYEVQLTYFQVAHGQDNSADEVRIEFNDGQDNVSTLWYGENLDDGDGRDLLHTPKRLFRSGWEARLWVFEQDWPDRDDHIGTIWIDPQHDPNVPVRLEGDEADGAVYDVWYTVSRA